MQNLSRRAFFGGKTPELSQWDQLLLQLRRKTQGQLRLLEQEEHAEQAIFSPSVMTDLHHVRQLCHACGISLYLWACADQPLNDPLGPVLWLDMRDLNQLMPVDQEKTQWFMQAGVCMGQLKEVGFDAVQSLPDELTVANWLADSRHHSYALSKLSESGLIHASLLSVEGSVNSLGPFGSQNTKPLNTAFLRQLVPQLFELASTEAAQALLKQPHWLGRYRLDMFDANYHHLNLAHLLLGHGGDLGVVEWVVIDKNQLRTPPKLTVTESTDSVLHIAAQEIDGAVKQLFDPDGLFSSGSVPQGYALYAVPQHV